MNDAAIAPPGVMPSQQPMTEERSSVTQYLGRSFQTLQHDAQADRGGMTAQRQPLFHRQQDLADAEQADHRDEEVDAAQQLGRAERHAQLAGHRVHADAGEQQAERHRDDGLVLGFAAEADEGAEGQQIDREEFRRPELQRKGRDHAARGR